MDLNDIRAAVTVLSLAGFAAIVWWVYSRRQSDFDAAANLPLHGETIPPRQGCAHGSGDAV
jgi:cbb3-type cytochrome oxidase subunit 3